MDTIHEIPRCYICKQCNKSYASYKSLWNHNKTFHNNDVTVCNNNVTDCNNIVTDCNNSVTDLNKKYNCKFCDKLFKCRQNKYSHEKTCKNKNTLITNQNLWIAVSIFRLIKAHNKFNLINNNRSINKKQIKNIQ